MVVVFNSHGAMLVAQHVGEIHDVGRVGGIGIPGPLQVTQRTAVIALAVVAAVARDQLDRLARAIRAEQRRATRRTVGVSRLDGLLQIALGRQVHDRVVDEDRIELPVQPHRAHVAVQVLAFRVERPADRKHVRREVDQGHAEVCLEVRHVVPTAAAKLQQRHGWFLAGIKENLAVFLRLLDVVVGRGEEGPPRGQVGVETGKVGH